MKSLQFAIVTLFLSLVFIGCKKSNDGPTNINSNTITGVWVGKFGTGDNQPSSFFSFNIKEGGILEELNVSGEKIGQGTWKLENKIFTAVYSYYAPPAGNKFSVMAAFNANTGKLLGNWGYNNSVTDGGQWEMDKK
jgi:hypothetical protein